MSRIDALRSIGVALGLLAVAGCGGAASATRSQPKVSSERTADPVSHSAAVAAAHPARASHKPEAVVQVAHTAYGRTLVDPRGFALYLFTHDRTTAPTCYDACAAAWPPYIVRGRPRRASDGARVTLLGSIRRRDGRLQVTYHGHPLYYYIGDRRPREVFCQAVTEFGGTWYVVAPGGRAVR